MTLRELPRDKRCWICEKDNMRTVFHCIVDNKGAWIHEECWFHITPHELRYRLPKHIREKYKV